MKNERQPTVPRQKRWWVGYYWQGSLLLLLVPIVNGDWTTDFRLKNDMLALATVALPNAHAHNDYLHEKPLRNALSRGFTSIEADVHLVGSELYLGHWIPQIFPAKTLREVYLEPLHALLTRQNGKVYPAYEGVFYLMIDIKTDSVATYRTLRQQLMEYPFFLRNPYFQVFISGNRAMRNIMNDPEQVAAVDGRLCDLEKGFPSCAMPIVSDNFRRHFKWRGKGGMPDREKLKLKSLAAEAHRQGKKLRFWATPDQPNVWQVLLDAGVDFISTDDLYNAGTFLADRLKVEHRQLFIEIK